MSTEQIYKDNQDKYISSERDNSLDRYQKAKFKIKRKIGQLENKAYFFQGQLNPITIENKALKQRLTQLLRAVSASSDLLRNLIPVQGNSTRKLQLQTANLEQISAMIKQDWLEMKENIRCMNQQIREKNSLIESLQLRYKQTVQNYESVIKNNQIKYEQEITELKKKNEELASSIEVMTCKWKEEKQLIIRSYDAKLVQAEILKKQYQQYIKDMNQKCANYERTNQRLRDQIALNLEEFQKSKLNLKQIYESIMQGKIDQMNEQFQMMMRMKEQQKLRMLEQMNANVQELKKKISEKNSQISHLSGLNDKLKQQIGAAKDQVWSQKLKIDAYTKQIKQLSERLFKQEETNKSFKLKLQESEQQIEEMKKKYAKSREEHEEQIAKQKAKYEKLEQALEESKKMYEGKLAQSQIKLQEFRRKLRQNDEKHQQMLQQERKKYEQRILKYEQDQKALKATIESAQKKIKQKQQLIQKMQKAHKQQLQELQKRNEQKCQKLRSEMEKIMYENEERIKIIRKQHERFIEQMQISNNEYIRKMVAEQNMKMYEQQQKYNALLQNSQNLKNELSTALEKNKILENQCVLMTENMKRAAEQHRRMLEEQRRESEKLLEMEKKKMFDQMQEQIASFKRAMEQKEAEYKNQLSQMQESMMKQINMLKMASAVDEVEEKYNSMIAKMKQEMENQLKKIEQMHAEELLMLSQKLEFDITKLNQDLLSQKQAHQFSKMSREDKINYLVSKITDYRNEMAKKDNQIIQLQYQIQKKNKQLQRVDQLVAEKVKKIKAEFDQEVLVIKTECQIENKKKQSECQRKVKKIQTERIQFTQLLYNEFQELKDKYDLDMRRLQKKYDQLERIFEERPSRAEDLSKIKQLIEERTKMDLQIKEFKKRVKQANQIVKYLNLQLQNYKQTYDIFGPGPANQPSSPQRRVNTQIDSPIRSLIRRDPTSIASEDSSRGHREKRTINQSQDINEFRLFPSIARNMSVAEDENQSETSHHRNKEDKSVLVSLKKRSGQKLMFSQKVEQEDKSEELRNNASIFMGLLNKDQKLPVQTKRYNGYSKKLSRRKSLAISYEKKLQLKDKTIVFEP